MIKIHVKNNIHLHQTAFILSRTRPPSKPLKRYTEHNTFFKFNECHLFRHTDKKCQLSLTQQLNNKAFARTSNTVQTHLDKTTAITSLCVQVSYHQGMTTVITSLCIQVTYHQGMTTVITSLCIQVSYHQGKTTAITSLSVQESVITKTRSQQ